MSFDASASMKVAVITPFHKTPPAWLNQCLTSVTQQTVVCSHFLVCDGDEPNRSTLPANVQVLHLPKAHQDFGNTPRAIGSVSAISQGFDAIAYLDSDNWYEPDHIQRLCEAHQRTGATILSSGRRLFDLEGKLLGPCPEVDGETFVDTNCMFLTRRAFGLVAAWYMMPRSKVEVGDRFVWNALLQSKLARTHLRAATVNYRTRHQAHYRHFGMSPPPGTKQIKVTASALSQPATAMDRTGLRHPRVSLNMIVRNEEARLERGLQSVANLVHEMIVVDTGSTDRTKQIAARHGAKVYDFPWIDDFAAARNECLRHSTGEWILWLDADESFDRLNQQRLRNLIGMLDDQKRVYMMKQWSRDDPYNGSALVVDQARLFPALPGVNWRHRIHEQILLSLREAGVKPVWTDIQIGHVGYEEASQRKLKLKRNLCLLQLEHAEQPDNSFTLFNLAGTLFDLGQFENAMSHARRCIEIAPKGATFLPKAYVLAAQIQRKLGQSEEALRFCREARERFPKNVELLFEEGLFCQVKRDLAAAQSCFEQIIQAPAQPCYVGVNVALGKHLARHHLALVYRDLGRHADAETQWREAVRLCPSFGPAWLALAELQINQKRFADVDALLQQLLNKPYGRIISLALNARMAGTRNQWMEAKKLATEAIAEAPQLRWLRMLLIELTSMQNRSHRSASGFNVVPDVCAAPGDTQLSVGLASGEAIA